LAVGLLRVVVAVLVAAVAVLAFVVSFEAISAFAVTTGAFPARLGWCAPLLVDSFIAAATLVILSRSLAGLRAGYAWLLLAVATGASLLLNVAHAPERLAARLVAALPPLAQLAAVELLMSEARRALHPPRAPNRALGAADVARPARNRAATTAEPAAPAPAGTARGRGEGAEGARLAALAAGIDGWTALDSRGKVRALAAHAQAAGLELTGRQVAAAVGLKQRRAQELLRELRTQPAPTPPTSERPADQAVHQQ